ncbi:MAG: Gfo/Idh/MocA family oxidoreductase [Oscillospiraceae bacterium]|nr:Gfo/Idh/MocA family oxidoreductase [Oscillospiraceae bacterium]
MKRIKTAIVGYGGMGQWHGEKLLTLDDKIEAAGTYDILETRQDAAKKAGFTPYPSFEAVLADPELELVTIATPNDLHKPLAIELMAAGKNVISEKPVTLCLADLDEMIGAAEKYGKLFTVHQNRRWDEDFLVCKKIIDDDMLGNAFRIESRVQGSRGIPGDWRNKKEFGGGMVLDWGVHLLDQMVMLKPDKAITSVYAELTYITNEGVDDGCFITLTFEDGFKALVEVGTSNFIRLPRWYVTGENGSAIVENWNLDGKITMVSDWEKRDAVPVATAAGLTKTMAPRTAETIKEYPLPKVESDVRDFYRNVYDVIRNGAQPLITHRQVRRVMKIMEAAFKSSETNSVVEEII